MAGPHRALAETRNAVESAFRDAGIDAGSRVLLAVSGGSDSMALAQAALFVASRAGVLAASLTVDHGWRQDSPDEARATRDRLAGLGARAKLDTQIGWHKSISNTEINGVSALKYGRTFDLLDKNCDANTLNNSDVTTLIRENGFRVWGNRTCSSDPMLAFEVAVRSAQIIQETIASAFLWAMDKPMHPSLIEDIIMGINAKLAEYVNKGYILGARVFLDKGKVTPQAIQAGQFAFDYEWTYVPPLENMVFNQHNTDTFFVNLVDKVISFASNLKATTI